ncbi:MAG: S1/P1 Nuclease [Bacteroidota bacterium]|nr:S1/P1 Nuclease [Bacteroidota bacterium]
MKLFLFLSFLLSLPSRAFCWGFYAHRQINYYAVFLLPPSMLVFYKPNQQYLSDHATDPDKRRHLLPAEAPRHYIDMDLYKEGDHYDVPDRWDSALARFGMDTLNARGIVPWWIETMLRRLTKAFEEKNATAILKLSADIGHYIADAHVPLHASSNHNGQYTGQQGIHGFWESRIPELLAEKQWDFFIGHAAFIAQPRRFIWNVVRQSAAASDTVLRSEKKLSLQFPPDRRYTFSEKNGLIQRQYAADYTLAWDDRLNGMVERRMRASIFTVASFWYTAWVNAGQPDLSSLNTSMDMPVDSLDYYWQRKPGLGRDCE